MTESNSGNLPSEHRCEHDLIFCSVNRPNSFEFLVAEICRLLDGRFPADYSGPLSDRLSNLVVAQIQLSAITEVRTIACRFLENYP